MRMVKKPETDMLNGSLWDKILFFSLPLALTGILQQFFNAADIAVVGQFVGKNAMAAVGSNAPAIGLLVNLFIGVSLGTNVIMAQMSGSGNVDGLHRAVDTSISLAVISGIALTTIGEAAAAPFLRLMSVPDTVFDMALVYLRVYLLGMPVILLYNFEAAIFKSQGDSKTPLICLTIAGVANIFLNLFFVLVMHMTASGVALATVISNAISAVMLFFALTHGKTRVSMIPHIPLPDVVILKRILRVGLPAGMQSMMFSISNICVQSAVNSLGADVMAACAAAFNIEILAYYVMNSFGQACTTFTGQNYGAGKRERCRRILKVSLAQNMLATTLFSLTILAAGIPLLKLFNNDATVLEIGYLRMKFILLAEPINVLIEMFSGAMRGYGRSFEPAILSLFGICGLRIAWVWTIFRQIHTFTSLMTCYPLSWCVTAIFVFFAYRKMIKDMSSF